MRGLKPGGKPGRGRGVVASFTDAWIETIKTLQQTAEKEVASFTDAWIETNRSTARRHCISSHLLQMRGLKLWGMSGSFVMTMSHLLQMRGLKPQYVNEMQQTEGRIFYRCVD